jgi:hypothetical protein
MSLIPEPAQSHRRRKNMALATEPLVLDFLEWLLAKPRPHRDVMEAWRTSCPRLTVWEDAVDAGYVERVNGEGGPMIRVTPLGLQFLKTSGRL